MSEDFFAAINAVKKLGIKVNISKKECKIFGKLMGININEITIDVKIQVH